jgi:mono/diheme cytochrome c family protein
MRIVKRILVGLAAVILVCVVVLYAGSQWVLSAGHSTPDIAIAVPKDAAAIAEGGRLARVMGCRDCHAPDGQGTVLVQDPMLGTLAPPALARIAPDYSDNQLARAIRYGVRHDGTTLWVMPSAAYAFIADDDLGKIVGWIRTLKPGPGDSLATTRFGPVGRGLVLGGIFPPSAHRSNVAQKTRPAAVGQYFTDTVCMGCHVMNASRPSDDGKQIVPPLAQVTAAYDLPNFRRLMRTGQGMSPKDLGMMRTAAVGGLRYFTDAEIDAIHAYLVAEHARLSGGK